MIEANKKNDYAYIKENDIYPDNAVKREKEVIHSGLQEC